MILTSHQPDFLPYMGFFYKTARSDVLVLSDDVQFSKSGMHNLSLIHIWLQDHPVHKKFLEHEVQVVVVLQFLMAFRFENRPDRKSVV